MARWTRTKIEELFNVGSSKRVLKTDWKTSGIPFYRGREITSLCRYGAVDNELYITPEHYDDLKKKYGVPVAGDIMITAIGTIGNTHIVRSADKFYFKDASVLWLSKRAEVDSTFINYWLKSEYFSSQLDANNGATVDTLTIKKLQSVKIDLPPLLVQKAIVAKLDAAFASIEQAIAAAERNAENAKQLFQSYLNDVFERGGERWVEKKFDEICVLQRGFDLPTQLRSEGEYPLVSSNGITDNISDFKIGSPGVVTGRSGTIGSVHYIEKSFWPLNTALYIKNFHGNCPKFIYYFLRYFKLERFSSGAGVPTLNRNVVHAALARVPEDIALQEKLAIDFDNSLQLTIRLEQIERKKKILYAEIKQSLLQQAFNGQLVDA